METCDSFNSGVRLIIQIHHQHDHIIETLNCTWHCTTSRIWSIWRSRLAIPNPNKPISAKAARKNRNVRFIKVRPQIDYQNPRPSQLYYRHSNLRKAYKPIKILTWQSTPNRKAKSPIPGKSPTHKCKTCASFNSNLQLITKILQQCDHVVKTKSCTWHTTRSRCRPMWRSTFATANAKSWNPTKKQTHKWRRAIQSICA